jgi:hypothetical protein
MRSMISIGRFCARGKGLSLFCGNVSLAYDAVERNIPLTL